MIHKEFLTLSTQFSTAEAAHKVPLRAQIGLHNLKTARFQIIYGKFTNGILTEKMPRSKIGLNE